MPRWKAMTFTELAVLAQQDPRWQDHHVRANAPLIRHCVRRWGRGIDDDEAEQVARIACIQALKTFDPSLGTWGTHARIRIRAELGRARHECHVVSGLRRRGGSRSEEQEAARDEARRAASLSFALPGGDDFGDFLGLGVDFADPLESRHEREVLARLIRHARLSPRQVYVLRAAAEDERQVDIAQRIGVSRQRVEQIERIALRKLRAVARRLRVTASDVWG